jgi:hypothetical protein
VGGGARVPQRPRLLAVAEHGEILQPYLTDATTVTKVRQIRDGFKTSV